MARVFEHLKASSDSKKTLGTLIRKAGGRLPWDVCNHDFDIHTNECKKCGMRADVAVELQERRSR